MARARVPGGGRLPRRVSRDESYESSTAPSKRMVSQQRRCVTGEAHRKRSAPESFFHSPGFLSSSVDESRCKFGNRIGRPTSDGTWQALRNLDSTRDTTRAAREAQLEALRRMGPGGRLRAGLRFSRSMIALSRAALRERHPDLDEHGVRLLWIEQNYGTALARAVRRHQEAVGWTSTTISSSP